jgi:transcriptional regulator with PAS, ATPase and Fis domain
MDLLQGHSWPGNTRELQNLMLAASVVGIDGNQVSLEFVRTRLNHLLQISEKKSPHTPPPNSTLQELECWRLKQSYISEEGVQTKMATVLNINRNTVRKKISECIRLGLWN